MERKTRVLHILWSGRIGGMEQYVLTLSTSIDKSRFDFTICFLNKGSIIGNELIEKGVKVKIFNMKSGRSIFGFLKFCFFISENKFEVIHCHCRNFLLNILLTFFLRDTKKIYRENGAEISNDNHKREILLYRVFSGNYSLILSTSEYTKYLINRLGKVPLKKIVTLYSGIKLDKFKREFDFEKIIKIKKDLEINNAFKIITTVGRLSEEKGIDEFIDMAFEIVKNIQDITFLIVGDGPERESLIKKIDMMKMQTGAHIDLRLLGFRRDIDKILSITDIYIFTSKKDSFPISLLEVLAVGVPIVGYDILGANEIVSNNRNGFLIKDRNPKMLANICLSLLNDPTKRRFFRENNIGDVKKFDIRRHVKKLEKIYAE